MTKTRWKLVALVAITSVASLAGCGSEEAGEEALPDAAECAGLENADCAALRRLEETNPLIDFGDDPCTLGLEPDATIFVGLALTCENGRVVELGLNSVGLTELAPEVFGQFDELTALSVGGNEIAQIDASAFDGLANLEDLFLFENRLKELPADLLTELSELTIFAVERNELTSIPVDLFANNPKLEIIQINANELTEISRDHFEGLVNTSVLLLGNNALTTVPADLFAETPNVEEITLSSNDISEFPTGLFEGTKKLRIAAINSNNAVVSSGLFAGEERSLERLTIKCNGVLPSDLTNLEVREELKVDPKQFAQPELAEWFEASPVEVEDDC